MTTFYSEHYSPDIGVTGHFTTRVANKVIPPYSRGARIRRTEARMLMPTATTLTSVTSDAIRIMDFRSGDRILEMYFSMDAGWGATATFHVGLYDKGYNDDGAVVDADLFVSTVDWQNAVARVERFTESTTLKDYDRGKALWELVTIGGAATYTQDPMKIWTLAATATQAESATAATVAFTAEVFYIAV